MGELSTAARRPRGVTRDKVGPGAYNYEARLGGKPFTWPLRKASITLAEDGGSEMAIESDIDLTPYANARFELAIGYGETLVDYFAGTVAEPADDHWGEAATANVWGPFKDMADQVLGEQVDYRNFTLAEALHDLHRRARPRLTQIDIRGGGNVRISGESEALYQLNAKISDVASALMEPFNWHGMDLPGYGRRVAPKPRPGGAGASVTTYTEAHFGPNAFKAVPIQRGFYAGVLVWRLTEEGNPAFAPIRVPIHNESRYAPPANKLYEIADFLGDSGQGYEAAVAMARTLARGTFEFSLSNIAPNPELYLNRQIEVQSTEYRYEGSRHKERYEVVYGCLIDKSLSGDLITPAGSDEAPQISLGGTAVKRRQKRLPKQFYIGNRRRSSYVLGLTDPARPPSEPQISGRWRGLEDVRWSDLEDVRWRELEQ